MARMRRRVFTQGKERFDIGPTPSVFRAASQSEIHVAVNDGLHGFTMFRIDGDGLRELTSWLGALAHGGRPSMRSVKALADVIDLHIDENGEGLIVSHKMTRPAAPGTPPMLDSASVSRGIAGQAFGWLSRWIEEQL